MTVGSLLAAGTLALHELRYTLVPGGATDAAHGYLAYVGPSVGVVCALALGRLVASAARGEAGPESIASSFGARWLMFATALVGLYAGQEVLEAWLASSDADLIAASGWLAVPTAAAVAGLIAVVVRTAERLLAALSRRRSRRRPQPQTRWPTRPGCRRTSVSPLAGKLASRAPPVLSVA